MITVRINNSLRDIQEFSEAIRHIIGSCFDEEARDQEYMWLNVIADNEDELEEVISSITSAYNRW